jgi:LysM repeat protein
MPLPRPVCSAVLRRRFRGAAAAALLALLPALHGCPPIQDRVARQDVQSLQTNVQQMESSVQARQAGVYEQIRDLREEQSRLDRLLEEDARQTKTVGQQVERLRERTQEELNARDKIQRDSAQAAAQQLAQLAARFEALQKDLQKGFQTLNDNIVAMSAFEKKQEERIAKIQEQSQSQLKVVVEEVGQANQELTRSVTAVRGDLDTTRQEAAAMRQSLVELQGAMQQIAERLAAAQGQLQALKRQESARKPAAAAAAARGGQHTVRAGETLTTIAARYGISVQSLMEKNQITDANSIREGQKLDIPAP